jgi:alkylated DNA repair dioxygenase AlkB
MTTHLPLSSTSSVTLSKLPEDLVRYCKENFDALYAHRPSGPCTVLVGADKRVVLCHRAYKSYGKTPALDKEVTQSYMFAGKDDTDVNGDLPPAFQCLLAYMQTMAPYNQVVVNYYENGDEYIPMHSDCQHGMVPGAPIAVLNIEEEHGGAGRRFTIKSRAVQGVEVDNVVIPLTAGLVVTMNGDCQKQFRHGVGKAEGAKRRMSVTFRSFM